MGASFFTIILTSAAIGGGGGLDGAQTAYMRCLDSELDAAIARRVDGESFRNGVARVCESETTVYRRMAVASMVGQGVAGASPAAAGARFDSFDRDNRSELVATFDQRMKLRRGPARVSGLAGNRRVQHD